MRALSQEGARGKAYKSRHGHCTLAQSARALGYSFNAHIVKYGILLCWLGLAVGSARLHAQSPLGSSQDTSSAVLLPGDLLRVAVWHQPDLSGDFVIGPDGSITHPLFREIKVAGVPITEVEARLRTYLSRTETNPTFVILPLLRVIVGGEVRQPNVLTLPPRTTVAQAIALAGGPTERAQLERVRLLRRGATVELNLTRADDVGRRMEIRSGDQIVVPRRRNFLQDYLAPTASVVAALSSVATLIVQTTRK